MFKLIYRYKKEETNNIEFIDSTMQNEQTSAKKVVSIDRSITNSIKIYLDTDQIESNYSLQKLFLPHFLFIYFSLSFPLIQFRSFGVFNTIVELIRGIIFVVINSNGSNITTTTRSNQSSSEKEINLFFSPIKVKVF